MIPVLFVIDSLEIGGTERSLLEIVSRFKKTQPVFCQISGGCTLREEFERRGIRVIDLDIPHKWPSMGAVRALLKVVRELNPAVIHSSLYRASIVSRVVAGATRTLLVDSFVNDSYSRRRFATLTIMAGAKLRMVQVLDWLTTAPVNAFVANSRAIAASNSRALHVSLDRVRVIHRGRDPAAFDVPPWRVREVCNELSPEGGRIILNVGRLRHRKGQSDLMRAMVLVAPRQRDVTLAMAGEGPFRGELERQRADFGLGSQVRLLGQRQDIPELLAAADVFAFPSHYEGLPGALIEAMFAGVPIVASDIQVHRECVEDGVSARLVPVKDHAALASAIEWVLDHPEEARAMADRARQAANERFHIEKAAELHESLYAELVDRQGP